MLETPGVWISILLLLIIIVFKGVVFLIAIFTLDKRRRPNWKVVGSNPRDALFWNTIGCVEVPRNGVFKMLQQNPNLDNNEFEYAYIIFDHAVGEITEIAHLKNVSVFKVFRLEKRKYVLIEPTLDERAEIFQFIADRVRNDTLEVLE